MEIWKDVEGYEGIYQVSNKGRVRSLDRFFKSKSNNKKIRKGQIIKDKSISTGYRAVILYKNGEEKTRYVHRLVAIAFLKTESNKSDVNHIDGDKTNNKLENLEWCTRSENIRHAINLGLTKIGSLHYNSKLNECDVKKIINEINENKTDKEIALEYGVDKATIFDIRKGKTWKHVSRSNNDR